jgi:hypothetical protein
MRRSGLHTRHAEPPRLRPYRRACSLRDHTPVSGATQDDLSDVSLIGGGLVPTCCGPTESTPSPGSRCLLSSLAFARTTMPRPPRGVHGHHRQAHEQRDGGRALSLEGGLFRVGGLHARPEARIGGVDSEALLPRDVRPALQASRQVGNICLQPRRPCYFRLIFQMTPVPGSWTRGPSSPTWNLLSGSDWPTSRTAP